MSAKNCSLAVDFDEIGFEEETSEEVLYIKINSHYHLRVDDFPAKVAASREVVNLGGTITVSF